MSLVGYARISTAEQNLALQLDALAAAGAKRIFEDRGVSGTKAERPGLTEALRYLREGDTLVVWKLDRLGRSCAETPYETGVMRFSTGRARDWMTSIYYTE